MPRRPYPVPQGRPSPLTHPRAFPARFSGVLWWGVLVLVEVGSGWCRVVCPVSRPGARVALRLPLRKGLRIALRGRLCRALCLGVRPKVRPASRRRVMDGLG